MAAAAILNLLPVAIFDIQLTFHFWTQPPHKIWCQYLNRRLTYCHFSKFKMAAVRHLGIVVRSCKTTHEASVVGHISLSNFLSIRRIVSKIWWFEFFEIWLEMPIHTPKILVFGGKIWENFPLGEKWPRRKLICTETRHWVHWASSHDSQGKLCVHSRN